MAQTLAAVITVTDRYSTAIAKIMKAQSAFEKKQDQVDKAAQRFNKTIQGMKTDAAKGASGLDLLSSKLSNLVSFSKIAKKALGLMAETVKMADMQQVQKNTLGALSGSTNAGTALYRYLSEYAKTSALSREELTGAASSFLPYTRDINQIEKLINLSERLYAVNPSQGASTAVSAVKGMLAGDTSGLENQFNMAGINGELIQGMAGSGDVGGIIDYALEAFDRFGASQDVVTANFDTLTAQTNLFVSSIKNAIGDAGTPVMENLSSVMKQLNDDMQAGKFQPFINLMVQGMDMIGKGIAWVVENLNWIAPMVVGAATAFVLYTGALKTAQIITILLAGTTQALTGNIAKSIMMIGALVGGVAIASSMSKNIENDTSKSLAQLKEEAGTALGTTKMPVEVTNTDPISVKGDVDIEQESLRYMLDLAGMKYMAKFSTATLAPQVNMYGTQIQQVTDLDEVTGYLTDELVNMTGIEPAGAY